MERLIGGAGRSVALALALAGFSAAGGAQEAGWLTVSGRVAQLGPGEFTLDHESGRILVELTGWPAGTQGLGLDAGERVTVSGVDSQDFRRTGRIRAFSVFNHADRAAFRADSAAATPASAAGRPPDVARAIDVTAVVGTVSRIEGRECVVQTAGGPVRVDTRGLVYDPFSAVGALRVDVGDRVSVSGSFSGDSTGTRRLAAEGMVVLEDG